MESHLQSLTTMNLPREVIERIMQSFAEGRGQLLDEIEEFEQAKRGHAEGVDSLDALGRALVRMRIAQGLSQRDLAHRVGVSEQTLSRSELNEYRGLTLERAARILDALEFEVKVTVARKQPAAAAAYCDLMAWLDIVTGTLWAIGGFLHRQPAALGILFPQSASTAPPPSH